MASAYSWLPHPLFMRGRTTKTRPTFWFQACQVHFLNLVVSDFAKAFGLARCICVAGKGGSIPDDGTIIVINLKKYKVREKWNSEQDGIPGLLLSFFSHEKG